LVLFRCSSPSLSGFPFRSSLFLATCYLFFPPHSCHFFASGFHFPLSLFPARMKRCLSISPRGGKTFQIRAGDHRGKCHRVALKFRLETSRGVVCSLSWWGAETLEVGGGRRDNRVLVLGWISENTEKGIGLQTNLKGGKINLNITQIRATKPL